MISPRGHQSDPSPRTRGKHGMPLHSPFSMAPLTTSARHSYALNFTRTSYQTTWVPLPEVAATRKKLGVPACRKHADGTDFPTLPILHDHSTTSSSSTQQEGVLIGDSFDIALHLHNRHSSVSITTSSPSSRELSLFPPNTITLHRSFNAHVDNLFSVYGAPLAGYYLPLDPATAEITKADMLRRVGLARWEDLEIPPGSDERREKLAAFEAALGSNLAAWFIHRDEGPFLEGRTPMYADMIVGGWLQWMRNCLPEWEQLRAWHGGLWGKLFDGLEEWAEVS